MHTQQGSSSSPAVNQLLSFNPYMLQLSLFRLSNASGEEGESDELRSLLSDHRLLSTDCAVVFLHVCARACVCACMMKHMQVSVSAGMCRCMCANVTCVCERVQVSVWCVCVGKKHTIVCMQVDASVIVLASLP